ncbi:MAG: cobalt ECF transporter T component CbiQ [Dehalococcoidia bacterium]
MKHSFIDRYSDRSSPLHRLDPRTKIATAIVFVVMVVVTPPGEWQTFAIYLAFVTLLTLISKVPPIYVLKHSLVVIPFVLLIGIFIPFLKTGSSSGSYNIWMWDIPKSNLILLGSIVLKSWLSVISLVLLTATTKFSDVLKGLERLRMPKAMVMILSFMYRYIFVLTDEVLRMKQARDSRSFGEKRSRQIKTVGNMIGTLFLRSYERGERVYAAMVSRGFDGEIRTLSSTTMRAVDLLYTFSFLIIISVACLSLAI